MGRSRLRQRVLIKQVYIVRRRVLIAQPSSNRVNFALAEKVFI